MNEKEVSAMEMQSSVLVVTASSRRRSCVHRVASIYLKYAARCVLAVSLACFPSGADALVKKQRPQRHREHPRITAPLQGIVRGGPWTVPTYADSTAGDRIAGEDLSIRR